MGFLQCYGTPAKMYPVAGCFAFTICVVYFQDAPRARIAAGAQNLSEHMLQRVYN